MPLRTAERVAAILRMVSFLGRVLIIHRGVGGRNFGFRGIRLQVLHVPERKSVKQGKAGELSVLFVRRVKKKVDRAFLFFENRDGPGMGGSGGR